MNAILKLLKTVIAQLGPLVAEIPLFFEDLVRFFFFRLIALFFFQAATTLNFMSFAHFHSKKYMPIYNNQDIYTT